MTARRTTKPRTWRRYVVIQGGGFQWNQVHTNRSAALNCAGVGCEIIRVTITEVLPKRRGKAK